jgi:hypothetical protein
MATDSELQRAGERNVVSFPLEPHPVTILRRACGRQNCFACEKVESVANNSAPIGPVAFAFTTS